MRDDPAERILFYRGTPEYSAWAGANSRCSNPKNERYHRYGGRGIRVCDEWQGPEGFFRFLDHIGLRPEPGLSLDRIDNDGGYAPGNVRWATAVQQSNNRKQSTLSALDGRYMTAADHAELAEIEAAEVEVKARRKRFFAKLRQRALRERRRGSK